MKAMRSGLRLLCLLALLAAGAPAWSQGAPRLPFEWIDVHVHPVAGRGGAADVFSSVSAAAEAMAQSGIARMIVMPPPMTAAVPYPFDMEELRDAIRERGSRFAFLAGGGSLNAMIQGAAGVETVSAELRERFERRAMEILGAGALGFGEITAHHLSLQPGHPYERVAADHPLLRLLADITARHDAVIELHFDVVAEDMAMPAGLAGPPNPERLAANLPELERLLAHNRGARIVWAHAGSDILGHWTIELSRRLLKDHPNLYMSLRMAPGRQPQNHPLTPMGEVKPPWLALLGEFPERFVIGGDQFFVPPGTRGGPAATFAQRASIMRERTRRFLAVLPGPLARRIGYENPMRIYRIKD
ncbi:MAG: hypothetical protein EXR27_02860 [Betaproteobacteria bacterium]|nr:hypothetical protein [Betaproteobacteria bacterium]